MAATAADNQRPAAPLSLAGLAESLRMPRVDDALLSVKTFVAAMTALALAFAADLQNPYWAALTAYIVTVPSDTGAIRSKALFRLGGTFAGGLLALAIAALFIDQTGILLAAYLAAITFAVWLKQRDRTPLAYAWFSVGVTTAVIGLATLQQPDNLFPLATARIAESALGISALLLVDSLILPKPMTPAFIDTMDGWRDQVQAWIADAIGPEPSTRDRLAERLHGLTAGLAAIDAKGVQLPFDTVAAPPRSRDLDALRGHLADVISDCIAIADLARAARPAEATDPTLAPLLTEVTTWLGRETSQGGGAPPRRCRARSVGPKVPVGDAGIASHALTRSVGDLVEHWAALARTLEAIGRPGRTKAPFLRQGRVVRNVDGWVSALDVLPLPVATGCAALLWYLTAWDSGVLTIVFAFIGSAFLMGQPATLASAAGIVTIVLATFALSLVYQFAVLPQVTAFPTLALTLGMVLIPAGLMASMNQAGVLICALLFGFLSLRNGYSADASQSLLSLGGVASGLLIATAAAYLCSYDRARTIARRLLRAVRRDVVDIASARRSINARRFEQLTIDRLAAFFEAAATLPADDPLHGAGIVRDYRIGANLLDLGATAPTGPLRQAVAGAYRGVLDATARPAGLQGPIDAAMGSEANVDRRGSLLAMRLAAA